MTERRAIKLRQGIPVLPSLDLEATVRFYHEKLGFRLLFSHQDYAAVARDRVELHFWQTSDPALPRVSSCRIEVDGIDALYHELTAQQVIHPNGKLETKPWGYKEFVALDLHGNALRFAEDVTGGVA